MTAIKDAHVAAAGRQAGHRHGRQYAEAGGIALVVDTSTETTLAQLLAADMSGA